VKHLHSILGNFEQLY